MLRPVVLLSVLFAPAALAPSTADAHGGGLNACGCHFNRRTGECHCHRDYGCNNCECQPAKCGDSDGPPPPRQRPAPGRARTAPREAPPSAPRPEPKLDDLLISIRTAAGNLRAAVDGGRLDAPQLARYIEGCGTADAILRDYANVRGIGEVKAALASFCGLAAIESTRCSADLACPAGTRLTATALLLRRLDAFGLARVELDRFMARTKECAGKKACREADLERRICGAMARLAKTARPDPAEREVLARAHADYERLAGVPLASCSVTKAP